MRLSNKYSENGEYIIRPDLDDLLKRLKKGMEIQGRILACIEEGIFVLRIWGYNIITESKQSFNQYDEVRLIVKEIEPHLVFDLTLERHFYKKQIDKNNCQTDILIR